MFKTEEWVLPERTAPDPADSPAVLLGTAALFFGAIAALAVSVPVPFFLTPFAAPAGGLALAFGAAGIHYARRGVGRLWVAAAGTALGFVGLGAFIGFLVMFAA
ncbi:hypothetical protein [Streptomyces sp. NPDC020965]|uniref:hypothetical protein n=1 Tax=Streptomyces sp. NPDC020965 TaxID=3365105 RepID=UPI0037A838D1